MRRVVSILLFLHAIVRRCYAVIFSVLNIKEAEGGARMLAPDGGGGRQVSIAGLPREENNLPVYIGAPATCELPVASGL